jgi:hypothetical protein
VAQRVPIDQQLHTLLVQLAERDARRGARALRFGSFDQAHVLFRGENCMRYCCGTVLGGSEPRTGAAMSSSAGEVAPLLWVEPLAVEPLSRYQPTPGH